MLLGRSRSGAGAALPVVVTEALADALVQLRAMLAAVKVEPRGETFESVVSLDLSRIEAALETSPEARLGSGRA